MEKLGSKVRFKFHPIGSILDNTEGIGEVVEVKNGYYLIQSGNTKLRVYPTELID